jgi:hypothetical protein
MHRPRRLVKEADAGCRCALAGTLDDQSADGLRALTTPIGNGPIGNGPIGNGS